MTRRSASSASPSWSTSPPSDTAMIFYLKNRDPARWSDRREVSVPERRVSCQRSRRDMTPEEAMKIWEQVIMGAEIKEEG